MNKKCAAFFFCIVYFFNLSSLNILFIDHSFPALTQTFVLNQITSMIDRGHEVTILSMGHSNYVAEHPDTSKKKPASHRDIEKYHLMDRVYYQKLPEDKRKYDVVICEFGHIGKMFLKVRKSQNIQGKFVTFFRGRDLNALPGNNKNFYKNLFDQGDYFIGVCHFFREKLVQLGCDPRKAGVIHSTIDCSKFCYRERKPAKDGIIRLISVNRLVEKKGTEYAIKAVAKLARKYKNIDYTIVGGGPLHSELSQLIQRFGAEKYIHLIGWRSHDEVIQLLDNAHIFILPSVTGNDNDKEGIPNAIMEAMAMGLPVVSTKHSGIPELVKDRRSGLLTPERDVSGLANRLEFLINHPECWNKMGAAGRQQVMMNFNKNVENERLENLCYYLASKNKRRDQ